MALSNPLLYELAAAFGIATEFWDWKGRHTTIDDDTMVSILASMDVDAADPERAAAALEAWRNRPWTRVLPPCLVIRQGRVQRVHVHVPHGEWVRVGVRLEEGGWRDLVQLPHDEPPRWIDGQLVGEAAFEVPGDLPLGYHRLHADTAAGASEGTLVVSPQFLGFPPAMGEKRAWGYAVQLYSVRSADSWGIGDLLDLTDLATWAATQQFASYILINPLHAAEPMPPLEPSPYLPSSRRFVNPLYVRPESLPEYGQLGEPERARIRQLKAELTDALADQPLIDRDTIWDYKLRALRIIHEGGLRPARRMALGDFVRREGRALTQFATWCALVTENGMNWREWPADFHRPSSPEVAAFAEERAADIRFYEWIQWVADLQLRSAQSLARDSGMRIGIMSDLAVGVSKQSAEAWTYGNLFAQGVSVGAPPDHFNQTGQDWGQSPWRPDRLDDLSYAPFRTTVAGLLRHSGGMRVDHIMGMFRLWWIPDGQPPTKGTYVRYNHEAMVGILALEAHRAGALIVGEDLGVVEPWVRDYLRERGILGTSIAWFEKAEDGSPLPPQWWRDYCLASVTTHDLPPTAGYLAKDHIRLQHELGLLTESLEAELAIADHEQASFIGFLRDRGFLTEPEATTEDIVLALHRYLVATPARVLCAALPDAVGDRRTQNQPGTWQEYPNWRIPLSHPDGRPMTLEELYTDERALRLAGIMNEFSAPPVSPRSTPEATD
ncbi:MAG: 4-alpha-glucanotransferase [Propionicimonas sp.]|nr:4-alpha-glucanotransferase [Propionicimonas sp.]